MKYYKPTDATIALTYKCNSHCRMCDIWKVNNYPDLEKEYLGNLSHDLQYINLTGGEPFLRADLPELVKIIKKVCPQAKIIISSNGLATDLIVNSMKRIFAVDKNIGVRISLDGGEKIHEQLRGVAGIYKSAVKTLENLRHSGVKNLGVSFTVMDDNIDELPAVYELSRNKNLELAIALVQNSDIYFRKTDNTANRLENIIFGLEYVIAKELSSWKIKRWFRAYYDHGLSVYARSRERLLPSGAGFDSLFIDPTGDIYPSNLLNIKMGNLGRIKLDETWKAEAAWTVRQKMIAENIQESWIICTLRGEMKRHWRKVAWWIIKNKFMPA